MISAASSMFDTNRLKGKIIRSKILMKLYFHQINHYLLKKKTTTVFELIRLLRFFKSFSILFKIHTVESAIVSKLTSLPTHVAPANILWLLILNEQTSCLPVKYQWQNWCYHCIFYLETAATDLHVDVCPWCKLNFTKANVHMD